MVVVLLKPFQSRVVKVKIEGIIHFYVAKLVEKQTLQHQRPAQNFEFKPPCILIVQCNMKILLSTFSLNGHTLGF